MEGLRRLLANPSQFRLDSSINDTFEWLIIKLWVDLLQNEVLQDFLIEKPSLYRMILRYVNPNDHTVMAKVKLSPENPNDAEQSYLVRLEPTREPAFVTVAGPSGNLPTPFILNPGSWTSSIATNNSLFLDYFALLPAAYYEATILQQKVLEKKKILQWTIPHNQVPQTVHNGNFIIGNSKRASASNDFVWWNRCSSRVCTKDRSRNHPAASSPMLI